LIVISHEKKRHMTTSSISFRVEMLREEIERIVQQERLYRQTTGHSAADQTGRSARELRLRLIREELAKLQQGVALFADQCFCSGTYWLESQLEIRE